MIALASVISTAFAVYSRKNADKKRKAIDREAMISGRWSEGYSFVPFEPKELDRTFIKKTTSPKGVLIEEEITNSWDGLLAYFQAPNIRFKIRHPLFLAIRFSNVLVILRDALRFPQESEEALRSFICSCGFPLHCRRDPAVKIGHGEFLPPWLIAFRSAAMKQCNQTTIHKLADLMKVVKGPALGFVPDDSLLPQRYSPTFDVASLGQLYTKLYAIEFAAAMEDDDEDDNNSNNNQESQQNGVGGGDKSAPNGTKKSRTAKRAKTKIEPVQADGLVGFHPCGTPIFRSDDGMPHLIPNTATQLELLNAGELDVTMDESSSGTSHHRSSSHDQHHHRIVMGPQSELMRSSFESYFIALHGELRMLLEKVVELVTKCVTRQDEGDVENLRKAYADFTEALSVHAYVEEHVLFKKLSDRVPNITESYTVDHELEQGRMDEISNIMKKMDARKITDLFLKISELAAVHKIHMDKEEVHLLPYFLKNFDDSEISELIRQCQSTISAKMNQQQKLDDSVSRITTEHPRSASASVASAASVPASAVAAATAAVATPPIATTPATTTATAVYVSVAAAQNRPTETSRSMAASTTTADDRGGMIPTGQGSAMNIGGVGGTTIGSGDMRDGAATRSMSTTTTSSSANNTVSQDMNTMVLMGNNNNSNMAMDETQADSETTSRVMQMSINPSNNISNTARPQHVEHDGNAYHLTQPAQQHRHHHHAHDGHVHFAPNTYDDMYAIGSSSFNGRPAMATTTMVDQQQDEQQQAFLGGGESAHNNSNNNGVRYGVAFRPGFRQDEEGYGGSGHDDDDRDSDKINLLNPRHQNAIERAIRAAGGMDNDSDSADVDVYVDPPDIIDDQLFFESGYVNGHHHDDMNNEDCEEVNNMDDNDKDAVERYHENNNKNSKNNQGHDNSKRERHDAVSGQHDTSSTRTGRRDHNSNGVMRNNENHHRHHRHHQHMKKKNHMTNVGDDDDEVMRQTDVKNKEDGDRSKINKDDGDSYGGGSGIDGNNKKKKQEEEEEEDKKKNDEGDDDTVGGMMMMMMANNSSSDFGLQHAKQQQQIQTHGGVQVSPPPPPPPPPGATMGNDAVLFKKGTLTSPNVSFSRNASGDDDVIALLEEIYN